MKKKPGIVHTSIRVLANGAHVVRLDDISNRAISLTSYTFISDRGGSRTQGFEMTPFESDSLAIPGFCCA